MNKLAPAAPWYAPWRSPVAAEEDPADLGTAFGLDLSLQAPPALAASAPPTPRPSWVPRWAARGKQQPT